MRIARCSLIMIATAASLTSQPAQAPSEYAPVIHVDSRLVNVPFIVVDRNGNRVTGLTPADLEVLDDGRSQPISHFAEDDAAALTIQLLVQVEAHDCGCRSQYWPREKDTAELVITKFLRPSDTAMLATFGEGGLRIRQNDISMNRL